MKKNPAQAADWLAKAADQDNPHAQFNLAYLYENGYGVPMNADLAKRWYGASAANGYEKAKQRLEALLAKLQPPGPTEDGDGRKPSRRTKPKVSQPSAAASALDTAAAPRDVRALDPGQFTLQLASHKSAAQARAFIDRHGLSSRASYFISQKGDSTWFKVIFGIYESYEAATADIVNFPAVIRKGKPWVRNIGKIQHEIE